MARSHVLKGFDDFDAALWLHATHPGLGVTEMVVVALENGLTVNDTRNFEAAQVLHEWGLADKKERWLTDEGKAFYRLWQTRRSDAIDVLHGIQYGLWSRHRPDENAASWTYRTVCEVLWQRNAMVDQATLARYVSDERQVPGAVVPSEAGTAISEKSVNGVYDWLLPLDPAVLCGVEETAAGRQFRDATFQRRSYCSASLVMMALMWLAREAGLAWGDPIMLDETARTRVCAFCLVEVDALEMLLDAVLVRFPGHLHIQTGWGTYITIVRQPLLDDFAE